MTARTAVSQSHRMRAGVCRCLSTGTLHSPFAPTGLESRTHSDFPLAIVGLGRRRMAPSSGEGAAGAAPRRTYELGKMLGKGSFGAVYLARETGAPAAAGGAAGARGTYVMKRIKLAHVSQKESKAAYQVRAAGRAAATHARSLRRALAHVLCRREHARRGLPSPPGGATFAAAASRVHRHVPRLVPRQAHHRALHRDAVRARGRPRGARGARVGTWARAPRPRAHAAPSRAKRAGTAPAATCTRRCRGRRPRAAASPSRRPRAGRRRCGRGLCVCVFFSDLLCRQPARALALAGCPRSPASRARACASPQRSSPHHNPSPLPPEPEYPHTPGAERRWRWPLRTCTVRGSSTAI